MWRRCGGQDPPVRVIQGEFGNTRKGGLVRSATEFRDALYLSGFVRPWEEVPAGQQLNEHAPHRPHVDLGAILGFAEQQLRRTVPERDDLVAESAAVTIGCGCPQIGDEELAAVIKEQVGGLDIAMHASVLMESC